MKLSKKKKMEFSRSLASILSWVSYHFHGIAWSLNAALGVKEKNKAERIFSRHLFRQLWKQLKGLCLASQRRKKKEERQKYSKTVKFQSPFSKYFLSIEITDAGYVKDFSFP